ncbi:hypothetical protein AZE42_07641 [Rhizopogon vesiculosus]|uniref:Uncharacterized protein n=1 Tax=Rhizopogon vesiculosus TaxID=180088 RepID=A0A1J8PTT7_9AGAM|nr:hypothetical protein AZE42_07641 [Rhizopogon vesiculosus]
MLARVKARKAGHTNRGDVAGSVHLLTTFSTGITVF